MEEAAGYAAATGSAAVFDLSRRTRLIVGGKAPGRMMNGVLSGAMPVPPGERDGVRAGRATYHAVLSPKGKMLTDLWTTLLGDEEAAGYLLDVPEAGREALLALFAKVLPPRFAAVRDATSETAMVALVGPDAADLVSRHALNERVSPEELRSLEEGEWRSVGEPLVALLVTRTAEVNPEAFLITGALAAIDHLRAAVLDAGACAAGAGVWSTLRVEAGRPAFGVDMDEDTIPIEAGIDARAIDHRKGCYTGQEVIVRIRDRGHVNRLLRLLDLGDLPPPPVGSELLAADGTGKVVGRITSAVESPASGGALALAYVARGVPSVLLGGHQVAVPE